MIRLARVPAPAENTSLCINSPGKDPVNLLTGANALVFAVSMRVGIKFILIKYCNIAQKLSLNKARPLSKYRSMPRQHTTAQNLQ